MKFWQIIVVILLISVIGVGVSVWQPWKVSQRNITVAGEGKVKSTPDVAKIQGGVETKKPTSTEAQKETTEKISKIIDVIKEKNIADKDIKTSEISAYPNYEYTNEKSTINGYVARTTIEVTIRDIDKGQEILNVMTENGVTNLYGPNLTFSDDKLKELKSEAQEEAVKAAKEKAEELASASGAKIGKVISITESGYSGGVIPMMGAGVGDTKTESSTIQPGENEITVNVSVSYQLK